MKMLGAIIGVVFLETVVAHARQGEIAHSPVTITRTPMEHLRFESSAVRVEPLQFQPLRFETPPNESSVAVSQMQHLDFGSRHQDFQSQSQHNFSNIRMQFENPQYQHLNFNAQ